ncbi:hypothetical protein V8C44DRAFT_58951 [Trichoderma aethiopicum]
MRQNMSLKSEKSTHLESCRLLASGPSIALGVNSFAIAICRPRLANQDIRCKNINLSNFISFLCPSFQLHSPPSIFMPSSLPLDARFLEVQYRLMRRFFQCKSGVAFEHVLNFRIPSNMGTAFGPDITVSRPGTVPVSLLLVSITSDLLRNRVSIILDVGTYRTDDQTPCRYPHPVCK